MSPGTVRMFQLLEQAVERATPAAQRLPDAVRSFAKLLDVDHGSGRGNTGTQVAIAAVEIDQDLEADAPLRGVYRQDMELAVARERRADAAVARERRRSHHEHRALGRGNGFVILED